MKEPDLDPERLAALLDGRLNERERRELLDALTASDDALTASDDALALYADAAAALREVEGDAASADGHAGAADVRATAVPRREGARMPTRSRRFRAARRVALAASIAVLALVPTLWLRTRAAARSVEDPGRFVALLAPDRTGLPASLDTGPWSSSRGAGDPLTPESRAARLGTELVHLEIAIKAGDARARESAAAIARLLDGMPAGGPLADLYRDIGERVGEPAQRLGPLLERRRVEVARRAGQEIVALAAWAEAGRVAVLRRDAAFFADDETAALLDHAARSSTLAPEARASAQRLQQAVRPGDVLPWGQLERELTALVTTLGS